MVNGRAHLKFGVMAVVLAAEMIKTGGTVASALSQTLASPPQPGGFCRHRRLLQSALLLNLAPRVIDCRHLGCSHVDKILWHALSNQFVRMIFLD